MPKAVVHTIGELVSASTSSCAVRSIDENGNDLTLANSRRERHHESQTGRFFATLPVTAASTQSARLPNRTDRPERPGP